MTEELQRLIGEARKIVQRNRSAALAAEMGRAITTDKARKLDPRWDLYNEFLAVVDGATFGSIDLWSSEELSTNQYAAATFPGGGTRWLIVGQLLYEPLALEAGTGTLRMFVRNGDPAGVPLGDFDTFLARVFSRRYAELVPGGEEDEWWSLLDELGVLRGTEDPDPK